MNVKKSTPKYITIGNTKIQRTAALAPMASVADFAFRKICKQFGAAMVTGEMVSAKGICYGDKKSAQLLTVTEEERPMAVQLFGSEPDFMARAAVEAAKYMPDFIDINCGCPVAKVVGTGSGSALMKDVELLGRIVKAVARATDIPVTVKIRRGWSIATENAVEAAQAAEQNGAVAVAVHARTKEQLYSGKADLETIAKVKRAISIPVIGNGDIDSVEAAENMYNTTGCDLVMIGRAACGRPWLFRQIKHYYTTGEILPEPTLAEQLEIMTSHIELLVKDKGEYIGMKEARKHTAWYLKGRKNAAEYRRLCGMLSTLDDYYALIQRVKEENL
ncbi:MAG: tRNA dihydrouridine synthase DusB [Eubacterium sp.]|nr:tRNA dihydrouridine synthase DusB [Eubacterium sp.]